MTPDIEKIEHLLNAKAFGDLNAAERELVLAHLSGAAEYEHMRDTLVRVKKVFVAEAASLAADAELKEQILNRFEQNKAKHPSLSERVSLFFQTLIPSPAGRFAGALTLLLLVVSVGFFMWPKEQPEMAQQLLPPATEPQIVTLSDHTPPAITLAVEKAKATLPISDFTVATVTEDLPNTATYEVMAREDGDAFIVAGLAEEKVVRSGEIDGFITGTEQTPPVETPAKNKAADQQKTEQSAPPVFMNNEGLYQYQNSRVADAEFKGDNYSDAYKNYSMPAKKAESPGRVTNTSTPQKPNAAATGNGVAMEEKVVQSEGKFRKSGIDEQSNQTEKALLKDISASSVPVWPGVETQANPYTATLESVKAFFSKETGSAYRTMTKEALQKSKVARLSLTFNAHGIITKVHVAGDVNEAQKKAFIQRALQLPTFRFSGTGKPLLEQTYVLELY